VIYNSVVMNFIYF